LIEGGGEVLVSAFAERLVDRVAWFIAPLVIGGREAPGAVGGEGIRRLEQAVRLDDLVYSRVGPDLYVEARVIYPKSSSQRPATSNRQRVAGRRSPVASVSHAP
jgi:diaminohydroxyphosphoribosylaminopyrimidine deaminase/5-amino-6-(5-phosphoribosylamino)uracil reductase